MLMLQIANLTSEVINIPFNGPKKKRKKKVLYHLLDDGRCVVVGLSTSYPSGLEKSISNGNGTLRLA